MLLYNDYLLSFLRIYQNQSIKSNCLKQLNEGNMICVVGGFDHFSRNL